MTPHIDRVTLLAYVENDSSIDRDAVSAHLAICADCRGVLADAEELSRFGRDVVIFQFLAADERPQRELIEQDVLSTELAIRKERMRADAFFLELRRFPIEQWSAEVGRRPDQWTDSLVQRIVKEVEIELNRLPEHALLMIDVAEEITKSLDDAAAQHGLGDCWKHRSNAFRHLGQYAEALDAAEIAEAFYRSLPNGTFDVGQALYTHAATLFKMTRFEDALDVLQQATAVLVPFGDSVPFAKTVMLEAGIRYDQGDTARAAALWRSVTPMLLRFENHVELARVQSNLAACALHLGQADDALRDAESAAAGFAAIGMDVEAVRARWTAASARLALGASEAGLDGLESAAAEFESRGMLADAGFVKLDITEELLHRREWRDASVNARELASLFTQASVSVASVLALSFLAEAVEGARATPALVQYVRDYVTADDPAQKFAPPIDRVN